MKSAHEDTGAHMKALSQRLGGRGEFAWVEVYKEIAHKLRDYKNRQPELVKILSDMKAEGLPTISLVDKDKSGNIIPPTEIDPFTFFSNFNRGIKTESRSRIIDYLRDLWGLNFTTPKEFSGIPVMNNMSAWFIFHKADREERDAAILWRLFLEALDDGITEDAFNSALEIRGVSHNITMGLYWINAEKYLNLDNVNRRYLKKHGINVSGKLSYRHYLDCMEETRRLLKKPFSEISRDAWLASNEPVVAESEVEYRIQPTRYWTFSPGRGGKHWEEFYEKGIMGIGWSYLGDLNQYQSKDEIRKRILEEDPKAKSSKKNDAVACHSFCKIIQVGDVVFAKTGMTRIVGWGIVTSDYIYDSSREYYQHVRKVDWKAKGEWTTTDKFALKTLTDITKYKGFADKLMACITDPPDAGKGVGVASPAEPDTDLNPMYSIEQCSRDIGLPVTRIRYWLTAMERKRQAVFYGPPGTGKTFIVKLLAQHIIGGTNGLCEFVQFHPAYTYEEFIQGIRPVTDATGNLQYHQQPGRFLEFCNRARQLNSPCVFIIDEINRANLARVFGELMYLLEYREDSIPLAGGNRFSIPENVLIIGTMNTADRSIALVDFALRRRFAFLNLSPEYGVLRDYLSNQNFNAAGLIALLDKVNSKIGDRNYFLGISFFLIEDLKSNIEAIWKLEIETYLEEFFYNQPEVVRDFRWDQIKDKLL